MQDFFEAACEAENPVEKHVDISDDLDFAIRTEVAHRSPLDDLRNQTFNKLDPVANGLESHERNLNAGRSDGQQMVASDGR
jgi:hypothetical protein